jgi:peptidoglycan/xylan/chitin deacetylase (PgdA/CDA1 family)
MGYLHAEGYAPLTVSQLCQAIDGGAAFPLKPVAITFDDGFADFYSAALPVLARLRFPSTLYVAAAFVGQTSRWLAAEGEERRRMLSWSQLRELAGMGVELGAHSLHHVELDVVPRQRALEEVTRSGSMLADGVGHAISTFAYPYGYHDDWVRQRVVEAGYTSACGVKHVMSAPCDDRFALGRIMVTRGVDRGRFEALLEGRGLRVAPVGERLRTRLWRLARRSRARLRRQTP